MAEPSRGLILLDRANQLLSEATSLDDLKGVRDAAEAARTFAKAAHLGLQLQNRAAELKLRAERKAGVFLAELHLKGGNRRSKRHRVTLKLDDFGITRQESTRWQLAASVPDKEFERYVQGKNRLGEELTGAGLLRLAKSRRRPNGGSTPARKISAGPQAVELEGRAELIGVLSELKSQHEHLSQLLGPLVTGRDAAYKPAERRYIGRLLREITEKVSELKQGLWNSGFRS